MIEWECCKFDQRPLQGSCSAALTTEMNVRNGPIHDAILVNANYEEEAKEVMKEAFRAMTGLVPDISTEHPYGEPEFELILRLLD